MEYAKLLEDGQGFRRPLFFVLELELAPARVDGA